MYGVWSVTLLVTTVTVCSPCLALLHVQGATNSCYVRSGDILIGMSRSIHRYGGSVDEPCSDIAYSSSLITMGAFIYVIETINADPHILPNITLGFVIMDTCGSKKTNRIQSLYFIPEVDSPPPTQVSTNCSGGMEHFHVAGIQDSDSSNGVIMTAGIMSAAQIPILSSFATSDELSDQSRFEYFIRMSPPDKYQSEAILDFLTYYNWTYFSLIFSEGNYGENGGKAIEKGVRERDHLCIASSTLMYFNSKESDYIETVNTLLKYENAKAVVLFMSNMLSFFRVIKEMGLSGRFIFIGSDSMGFSPNGYGEAADGAFVIHFPSGGLEAFNDYYYSLTPAKQTDNPWIHDIWEVLHHCKWNRTYGNESCDKYANTPPSQSQLNKLSPHLSKHIDTAYVLGLGLDSLIRTKCPDAFKDQTFLDACITGPDYLEHIKKLEFIGTSGKIKFDSNGDAIGNYLIRQYLAADGGLGTLVGRWDKEDGNLVMHHDKIDWSVYYTERDMNKGTPESLCSKPCNTFEYFIQKELSCCWECRSCRENEIIINSTSCNSCEAFKWPDKDTKTLCLDINPTYMYASNSISIGLMLITVLGICGTTVVTFLLRKNKTTKLIKASSKDLMVLILIGILFAYLTIFAIISKPNSALCTVSWLGFNISVCMIYIPLLVKTNRIYRIFSAGRKSKQRPWFISSKAQLIVTWILILGQVIITITMVIIEPPKAHLKMPFALEEYVELVCETHVKHFVICLSYNLFFMLCCAVFGFLTRKLPENFSESWYIFVSVSTTTFLWMVFLPAYFTAFYAYYQAALLSFCLFLNATVTLLCLYVPKLYAIYFVDENKQVLMTATTNATNPATVMSISNHRVNYNIQQLSTEGSLS